MQAVSIANGSDQGFDAKIIAAKAQLHIPYEALVVKALDFLTHGLVKLRLFDIDKASVYLLADALHRIPRNLNANNADQLRQDVAEAMVALDELALKA
ncbi:hypothetical protein ACI77O_12670 [Pseudomonas tritici]|uniref:hypothetical protein n=1 Tax=Pseudomonas tritici TaxID=2745518 RepID=UPI00387B2EB3